MDRYDKGFEAGLQWCARAIRLAALEADKASMGQFEQKTEAGTRLITAIAKTSRTHFANSLRSVANAIEEAIKELQMGSPEDAESTKPPVQ